MSSSTRRQLEDWLKVIKLKAESKVLDIGGSQLPIKDRLGEEGDNSKFIILDLRQPHITKKEPDHTYDVQLMNFSDMYNVGIDSFDVAFCLEVSEYWYNPLNALQNIHSLLKSGGKLYISFHFLYGVHNPEGEDCLRYTPEGAEKLLKKAGFEIIEHKYRVSDDGIVESLYSYEGMRVRKGYNHSILGSLITVKKK